MQNNHRHPVYIVKKKLGHAQRHMHRKSFSWYAWKSTVSWYTWIVSSFRWKRHKYSCSPAAEGAHKDLCLFLALVCICLSYTEGFPLHAVHTYEWEVDTRATRLHIIFPLSLNVKLPPQNRDNCTAMTMWQRPRMQWCNNVQNGCAFHFQHKNRSAAWDFIKLVRTSQTSAAVNKYSSSFLLQKQTDFVPCSAKIQHATKWYENERANDYSTNYDCRKMTPHQVNVGSR